MACVQVDVDVRMSGPHTAHPIYQSFIEMPTRRYFGANLTNVKQISVVKSKKTVDKPERIEKPKEQTIIHQLPQLPRWDVLQLGNELYSAHYVSDIMDCYYENEQKYAEMSDYFEFQKDITPRMRQRLVDWLLAVSSSFQLSDNTFYLAINLFDRYLGAQTVGRDDLAVIGCACLWVASKYCEIHPPEKDDFIYISGNSFTSKQLLEMESQLVIALEFRLSVATPLQFVERYIEVTNAHLKQASERKMVTDLAQYFVCHLVHSFDVVSTALPSQIAAAAMCYAVFSTKLAKTRETWDTTFAAKFGMRHSFGDLLPISKKLDQILNRNESGETAVRKLFHDSDRSKVSQMSFARVDIAQY